jgi:hypothetical protein
MRRHCDGTDPNLLRPDDSNPVGYRPCDCGLIFDDVYRSTVWPHYAISGVAVGRVTP